ncbi:MAG: HlyD family secretion protein [Cyclobacteriaceae bacterium]|nr:HlyD family secretion protein [Cyclobacteriaceae bacterium]
MKKFSIILLALIVLVVVLFFAFKGTGKNESADILVSAETGKFIVDITTTGELEAKNSVKIIGPVRLRDFRIYNVTINDIVPEGTIVQKGDWVANLDRSEFNTKLQDKQIEVEKAQSQYIQTQLDTALQMRQSRDDLINLKYAVTEAELVLEQSAYEPPATVKQNEINLEKAIRNLQQASENYKIKLEQNKAKMQEVAAELRKNQRELNSMLELANAFTVYAPESGMVIYAKGWDGKAIKAGSQINSWDPTVATLPDLTTMVSKTYINEVDVRKIKIGQPVEIGLDAFPEKRLTGTVTNVANVGEQKPNSDAKVFEALIEISGTDPLLKPAMTTSNRIITQEIDNTIFLPLESFHNKDDSITFVYKKQGLKVVKQEVQLGSTNNNEAEIKMGLEPGDKIYLSVPAVKQEDPISLLPEMDGKRRTEEPTQVIEAPREREITLPDGRKITVPADGQQGQFQGGRPGGNDQPAENADNLSGTANTGNQPEKKAESPSDNTPAN